MTSPRLANLRCCASCEWIWRKSEDGGACPKCQFGSYSAHRVHGDLAYSCERTQEPWVNKQVASLEYHLENEAKRNFERLKAQRKEQQCLKNARLLLKV